MIIKTTNLTKTFRTSDIETIAVNNICLEIENGEFVAIMGPSGCGKTTLLNILGLLDSPTSGSFMLNGSDVGTLGERDRTLTYMKIPSAERRKLVNNIMQRMEISHRAKHFPHQLSGGQQQRVAIARAVVSHPDLVLADEPTGNLDSKNGAEVMRILSELNAAGTTIVMVTHNKHDAEYAARVVEMLDGKIVSTIQNKNL